VGEHDGQGVRVPVRVVGGDFDPGNAGLVLTTDIATLTAAQPGLHPDFYDVTLAPGSSAARCVNRLSSALRSTNARVEPTLAGGLNPTVVALDAPAALLTLMLVSVAGIGVLNSVVLDTRERVHDLGVCKAIGMTPGRTTARVLTQVAGAGLLGAAVGVPTGLAPHDFVLPLVLRAAGSGTPPQVQNVYGLPEHGPPQRCAPSELTARLSWDSCPVTLVACDGTGVP
jgi:putative ABC transport system permease protein